MRKKALLSLPVFSVIVAASFSQVSNVNMNSAAANISNLKSYLPKAAEAKTATISFANIAASTSTVLYDSLKLDNLGLSRQALDYAYKGYTRLAEEGKLLKSDILTVCDFSQSSNKKRLYVIDTKNFKVLMNTYVAHGRNSGLTQAEKFSNNPESLQSSLGFYITEDTYTGKHGLSLRINGLEKGWNDKAEERAVVVHGADYIGDSRLGAPYMGRSFGCPAVPQKDVTKLIELIKKGTCLFIYHPSENYLHGSKILNA